METLAEHESCWRSESHGLRVSIYICWIGIISPHFFPLEDKASRMDIAKGQLSSQEGEL